MSTASHFDITMREERQQPNTDTLSTCFSLRSLLFLGLHYIVPVSAVTLRAFGSCSHSARRSLCRRVAPLRCTTSRECLSMWSIWTDLRYLRERNETLFGCFFFLYLSLDSLSVTLFLLHFSRPVSSNSLHKETPLTH